MALTTVEPGATIVAFSLLAAIGRAQQHLPQHAPGTARRGARVSARSLRRDPAATDFPAWTITDGNLPAPRQRRISPACRVTYCAMLLLPAVITRPDLGHRLRCRVTRRNARQLAITCARRSTRLYARQR